MFGNGIATYSIFFNKQILTTDNFLLLFLVVLEAYLKNIKQNAVLSSFKIQNHIFYFQGAIVLVNTYKVTPEHYK